MQMFGCWCCWTPGWEVRQHLQTLHHEISVIFIFEVKHFISIWTSRSFSSCCGCRLWSGLFCVMINLIIKWNEWSNERWRILCHEKPAACYPLDVSVRLYLAALSPLAPPEDVNPNKHITNTFLFLFPVVSQQFPKTTGHCKFSNMTQPAVD